MTKPLIKLEQVDVALNGQTILRGLHWQLRPGQHWAILGGDGSGKSTLLKLIRGDLWPRPGRGERIYSFDGGEQTSAVGIKEKIGLVSPELHERYLRQAWVLTGWQVIQTGFFNTDYLYQKPTPRQMAIAASISRLLGVEGLLARNVQQLSTGELRKILIARALAGEPRILIFDEVCDGLDAPSRAHLLQTIERVARAGTQIIYTTHRAEEVIPAITHELVLKQGRIVSCGEKNGQAAARSHKSERGRPRPRAGNRKAHADVGVRAPIRSQNRVPIHAEEGRGEGHPSAGEHISPPRKRASSSQPSPPSEGGEGEERRHSTDGGKFRLAAKTSKAGGTPAPLLVCIRQADVFLGRRRVLHGIDWEMRADENWAVLGPNGAGKSTFLKLVFGDLHPAAGARIQWFGLPANRTVWELKKRIGFVSPEFQANYLDE